MSVWNKFNAELKRRGALAWENGEWQKEEEEEEDTTGYNSEYIENLARSKKEKEEKKAQEKERKQERTSIKWAAKSPEEKKQYYVDSFSPTIIDGNIYLKSSEDNALTDAVLNLISDEIEGTFIGYSPAEDIIWYEDTPIEPYDGVRVWDQNDYGQYIINNYTRRVETEVAELEENEPDTDWGEPRISEEVQKRMNANLRPEGEHPYLNRGETWENVRKEMNRRENVRKEMSRREYRRNDSAKPQFYRDSFFPKVIDGKIYLQSSEDGAVITYFGALVGYLSGETIHYTKVPHEPYEDTRVWNDIYLKYFDHDKMLDIIINDTSIPDDSVLGELPEEREQELRAKAQAEKKAEERYKKRKKPSRSNAELMGGRCKTKRRRAIRKTRRRRSKH